MNKEMKEEATAAPAAKPTKKKGTLVSILSVLVGVGLGVIVAYMQFRFAYADNPSKYFDPEINNYIWVNVLGLAAPWFLVCALGTPMVAFAYIAFKRMLKI